MVNWKKIIQIEYILSVLLIRPQRLFDYFIVSANFAVNYNFYYELMAN